MFILLLQIYKVKACDGYPHSKLSCKCTFIGYFSIDLTLQLFDGLKFWTGDFCFPDIIQKSVCSPCEIGQSYFIFSCFWLHNWCCTSCWWYNCKPRKSGDLLRQPVGDCLWWFLVQHWCQSCLQATWILTNWLVTRKGHSYWNVLLNFSYYRT